ncbi:MAG: response regulator transcription factor [Anaerolineae bacterium]|nr:response regulator transcription factor [Anaerolineae bacterium]
MAEPVRTLVVDDDEAVRFFVSEALRRDGHAVTAISSGEEALEQLRTTPFDLAILDLHLSGRVDGLRVLEAVAWRWPETATIILTAHGSLDSAMAAIREGVDAYVLKPIEAGQLRQTACEALLHRQRRGRRAPEGAGSEILRRGPFLVDLRGREVMLDGKVLNLSPSEFQLLAYLMEHAGRVISPTELVGEVRGYDCDHLNEARDVIKWYIHRLRKKVEPNPSHPCYILNVRGVGYTFKG